MRFQIVIAVWGDKFIDQMCEVCLPCVLASNNLPAIPASERFRFVFVTRASDVKRLEAEPTVQRIRDLIPVVFLEFDPSEYTSTHLALSAAHRMALAMAARESAHFVLLDPDLVFSNNTLASARRMAAAGKSAIMVSGLRLATESAMPALRASRLSESSPDDSILEPRRLMKFAMDHFHPEVARYYFDSPAVTQWPLVCLWPVHDQGLLDRSFHLHPLVLDMRCAKPEALSTLDHDTIDGAYAFHAFPDCSKVYVEGDSDNMLLFSFSSLNECIEPLRDNRMSVKLLCDTAYMFNVNALHRSFFDSAIKLHTGDLDDAWLAVERGTATLSRHFRSYSPRRVESSPRRYRSAREFFGPTWDRFKRFAGHLDSWVAYQNRGIRRDAAENHRGAARDFARAIRIGPPNPALHFLRGLALLHAGNRRKAKSEFEAGLRLDPNNETLRYLLDSPDDIWIEYQDRGIRRDGAGDHHGAAEDFAQAIRVGPPNPALHFLRGVALLHAGNQREAMSEFESGLRLDPDNTTLQNLLNMQYELNDGWRWRRPGPKSKWGLLVHARFALLKLIFHVSWQKRERIRSRLKASLRDAAIRTRVRWRIRQLTTAIVLGHWLPELSEDLKLT